MTRVVDPNTIAEQTLADSGKASYVPATDCTFRGALEQRYTKGNIEQPLYIRLVF